VRGRIRKGGVWEEGEEKEGRGCVRGRESEIEEEEGTGCMIGRAREIEEEEGRGMYGRKGN
jgi:hypothetical protein